MVRDLSVVLTAAAAASAVIAPAAGAACWAPVRDGRNSVVDCRPVGHEQPFVVPAGVSRLTVIAVGARGGDGTPGGISFPASGGVGAVASGAIRVTPGNRIYVLVGGAGGTRALGGAAGFNGGGAGGSGTKAYPSGGGGGGGASDVRTCSTLSRRCNTLASRLIVAAGGGGGGGGGPGLGNATGFGGSVAADGTAAPGAGTGAGGGATSSAGGGGGPGAGSGALGAGGKGAAGAAAADSGGGGGGGGGRYGGGGGANKAATVPNGAGGGAGSSFGPRGTTFAQSKLPQAFVRISFVTPRAPNPPPAVTISRPRSGATVGARGLVVSGRARDASGVRGVALRIERLPRPSGGCTWLYPSTGLRVGPCGEPPSLHATLRSGGRWSYRVASRLRSGSYRVTAYGTDETGIYGNSAPRAARSLRFRVRG